MERKMLYEYMKLLDYENVPVFLDKYLLVPSLIRLKQVGYFCGMDYASKNIYDFGEKISRYDHSLTVALITWKLTKDVRATLAALFHDISTPCFSHVIDYMNKDYEKQESTEEKTEEILRNDLYLLECLKQDDISVDEIIDFKKYSIVDLDRPMLCADRLDGVILTGMYWTKNINIDDVRDIILDMGVLINENNQEEIGFNKKNIADLVLKTSKLIDLYCHSKEDNYMMELLAHITKRAIDLGIIDYDDLFRLNEDEVFSLFYEFGDVELISGLKLFMNIDKDMILDRDMPKVKIRDLNPLICNRRLKR